MMQAIVVNKSSSNNLLSQSDAPFDQYVLYKDPSDCDRICSSPRKKPPGKAANQRKGLQGI
jgi:hypothetical protein